MSLVSALVQSSAREWLTIVSLVFGGCCTNALALEWLTAENAHAGQLITFAQFAVVSIVGLSRNLCVETTPRTASAVVRKAATRVLDASRTRVTPPTQPFVLVVDGISSPVSKTFTSDLAREMQAQDASVLVARSPADALPQSGKSTIIHIADSATIEHSDAAIVFSKVERSHPTGSCLVLHPSRLTDIVSSSGCFSGFDRTRIYLKQRRIPITVWMIQVVLFLLTSLLNNIAFAYKIPMSVHIIFRSAGSLTNMIIGWMIGRRYSTAQVASVLLVTAGVAASTYSAVPKGTKGRMSTTDFEGSNHTTTYLWGILILSLALVFSSVMGLEQDRAYRKYGRGNWQEAMFYLHFLAMPMFALMRGDLAAQIATANASPPLNLATLADLGKYRIGGPFALIVPPIRIPSMYVPLGLNVLTQLVCVSGVHRLTSRVTSLTVTLVLVVRKAVSLWISVVLLGRGSSDAWLWGGALAVLAGTILYSLDNSSSGGRKKKKE